MHQLCVRGQATIYIRKYKNIWIVHMNTNMFITFPDKMVLSFVSPIYTSNATYLLWYSHG